MLMVQAGMGNGRMTRKKNKKNIPVFKNIQHFLFASCEMKLWYLCRFLQDREPHRAPFKQGAEKDPASAAEHQRPPPYHHRRTNSHKESNLSNTCRSAILTSTKWQMNWPTKQPNWTRPDGSSRDATTTTPRC